MTNLNTKYRPKVFDQVYGQENVKNILANMIKNRNIQSCIFYGPPGTGKTTIAQITGSLLNMPFLAFNATSVSTTDIKKQVNSQKTTVVLYIDEIQYFNKRQQQALLPIIESKRAILIASTTDNPYHCCYDSLLSRCLLLEFKHLTIEQITQRLRQIAINENIAITGEALILIARSSGGDMRRAVNQLEMACTQFPDKDLNKTHIRAVTPSICMNGFDINGEIHYQLLSALQKSIRGSDPDATIFYLTKLLYGGDIQSPCRRLLVIACEDIGLAQPGIIAEVYACCEIAKELGLPEAYKPLTIAALRLALAPKSSSCEKSYMPAIEDIEANKGMTIPEHIRTTHPENYRYPHDYPDHYVDQQYLPDDLVNTRYYHPEDNDFEQKTQAYWNKIKIKSQSWTCPNCNAIMPRDNQFCTQCGTKKIL